MAEQKQRIACDKLRAFIASAFEAVDVPRDDAKAIAQLMAQADINGSEGHGVFRLPQYIRRIKGKAVNVKPNIRIEREMAGMALINGDNGMGHLVMKFATENLGEPVQKTGIVHRIVGHFRGKRAARPVRFLGSFGKLEAEIFFDQGSEAELDHSTKPRRNHRIKEPRGTGEANATQQTQIVIGTVQYQLSAVKCREERLERKAGKRVNERITVGDADLNETKLFEIAVEAVRFRIERNERMRVEARQEGCERLGTGSERDHQAGDGIRPRRGLTAQTGK
jgi:hypothetical protein